MTRTFIALELDASQQHFLGNVIRQGKRLLPDVRWVDPASIHLTLAFLGELNDEQLEKARAAARSAATLSQPFSYRLSGLGTFGTPRSPRVLWMGVSEPSGALTVVHQALSLALEQRGFAVDKRPFSPHLTLARIKSPLTSEQIQHLQQLISRYQFASPAYHVMHLYVMKSELFRSGALYTCLEACSFQSQ
ncbi:MAG TPA: RNA 2',3'-cyclic phosphodiesterase [Ktedonobacteraceae bacterium]|jgi:2'-5' RNA ligase|nr:RNA 2',3'-cyclic phosphodiesterase [Ktedonobacteraceae bacterium]